MYLFLNQLAISDTQLDNFFYSVTHRWNKQTNSWSFHRLSDHPGLGLDHAHMLQFVHLRPNSHSRDDKLYSTQVQVKQQAKA